MLVAPLVVSTAVRSACRSRVRPVRFNSNRGLRGEWSTLVQYALLTWIIGGLLVLALIPAARGDGLLGATLPFWLVVAPVLDLIWLSRANVLRMARVCTHRLSKQILLQACLTHRAASPRTSVTHLRCRDSGFR